MAKYNLSFAHDHVAYLTDKCENVIKKRHQGFLCYQGFLKEDLVVYKKTYINRNMGSWFKAHNEVVTKLLLPAGTRIHWALGNFKCRAEMAIILSNTLMRTGQKVEIASSGWTYFDYVHGALVVPKLKFSPWGICKSGIHFFLTRDHATSY